MFDFIPIQEYTPIYFYLLLMVVLLTFLQTQIKSIGSSLVLRYNKYFGDLMFVFVVLYMGLRPINGIFIDMMNYNRTFERYAEGQLQLLDENDVLFQVFTMMLSSLVNAKAYFFICATLYIVPLYIVCKKWFKEYWFYGFLFLIGAFSFWAYGVNGIRNGIAGSIFILAISREKRLWQIFWFIIAINFHKTMLLPVLGFVVATSYEHPKRMMLFWLLCIPVSLISSGFFENLFASLGFEDERLSYLTDEANVESFSSIGFRWDFLVYSATAVFAGWYYIVKKQYKDKLYFLLFNTYVFANAFWILVIRANFSNRFAYLSWFMIGLVIIYPLLKQPIIKSQHKIIGLVLMIYFFFTFFMNVILK